MSSEVLLIPGNNEQPYTYKDLVSGLQAQGQQIFPLRMAWTHEPDLNNWVGQVESQIGDTYQPETVIGFSYGAATALVVTANLVKSMRPPRKLILCSPSAVFCDDLADAEVEEFYQKTYDHIPKGIGTSVEPLIRTIVSSKNPPEVVIFYGSAEISFMQKKAQKTADLFGVEPQILVGAKHQQVMRSFATNIVYAVTKNKS